MKVGQTKDISQFEPPWFTLDELSIKSGLSITALLSLAEQGKLTCCALYTLDEFDELHPDIKRTGPSSWDLTSFQIRELVSCGKVIVTPTGTVYGLVDREGRPLNHINHSRENEEFSPNYSLGVFKPKKLAIIDKSRLRVRNSERLRILLSINENSKKEATIEKKSKSGGRPVMPHTILCSYFIVKYPDSTYSQTDFNFQKWLKNIRNRPPEKYEVNGVIYDIEVSYDSENYLYEFSMDGEKAVYVSLPQIKERFKSMRKKLVN